MLSNCDFKHQSFTCQVQPDKVQSLYWWFYDPQKDKILIDR